MYSLVMRAPRLRPHASAWTKAIVRLSERVRNTIHSRVDKGDHMDITNYVKARCSIPLGTVPHSAPHLCVCVHPPRQIRGIPGGRIEDDDYVAGITVRKNVNHKVRCGRVAALAVGAATADAAATPATLCSGCGARSRTRGS